MFSGSVIDPGTIQVYRETEYRVLGELPFTLRVGQVSAELLAAHIRHRADCSAFLTACNPFSQILDSSANAARQQALSKEFTRRRLAFVEGVGQHPSNQWPGEASFLVFGMTPEAAKTLGSRLEQNGIIWGGADGVPELILLRSGFGNGPYHLTATFGRSGRSDLDVSWEASFNSRRGP